MSGDELSKTKEEDVGFSSLILMFRTSGLIGLGEIPHPLTDETKEDLDQMKESIYFLEVLEKKTSGNLTQNEERELGAILFELRMKYLQKLKDK
jgi:hypothetical protein